VPNDVRFKLMAVNAIYFFGSWAIPFNKTFTSSQPFTTPDGKSIQVGGT
jgi:serine protease inhibitor